MDIVSVKDANDEELKPDSNDIFAIEKHDIKFDNLGYCAIELSRKDEPNTNAIKLVIHKDTLTDEAIIKIGKDEENIFTVLIDGQI